MGTEYPPVLTKRDFVRRYAAGEFGNHSPTWDTLEEFVAEGLCLNGGLYHVRNRVAGAKTWYNVDGPSIPNAWREAAALYAPPQLYISAMAPTELTVLQGEVQQRENGLNLFYTRVRKPMRDALAERSESVTGILAYSILREALCPNSYEWLEALLDRYPGHVVEFSTYSKCWGTLRNFNTVFWEVRQY